MEDVQRIWRLYLAYGGYLCRYITSTSFEKQAYSLDTKLYQILEYYTKFQNFYQISEFKPTMVVKLKAFFSCPCISIPSLLSDWVTKSMLWHNFFHNCERTMPHTILNAAHNQQCCTQLIMQNLTNLPDLPPWPTYLTYLPDLPPRPTYLPNLSTWPTYLTYLPNLPTWPI